MPPPICSQLQTEYLALKAKKQEFDLMFQRVKETDSPHDLKQAKKLMKELKEQRVVLQEKLWPFEKLPLKELEKQHQDQLYAYKETEILEKLSNNEWGIKGIDNKEYVFPTFNEIKTMMRENRETLQEKTELGFTRLQITLFALPLATLKQRYGELIKKKYKEGKLQGVNGDLLELEESAPVYMNEDFDDLSYFPEWKKHPSENKSIAENGITKEQAIKQIGGFNIILTEDMLQAPEQGKGETKHSKNGKRRKQIEGGMLVHEQFEKIKEYNETGYSGEDWFCHAILELFKNDKVLDDDQSKFYYCRLLGISFSASADVPCAYWNRVNRRAGLAGAGPGGRSGNCGVRPAVRVPA